MVFDNINVRSEHFEKSLSLSITNLLRTGMTLSRMKAHQ